MRDKENSRPSGEIDNAIYSTLLCARETVRGSIAAVLRSSRDELRERDVSDVTLPLLNTSAPRRGEPGSYADAAPFA